MITLKMVCTRKYDIDDKRGSKVFLDVPDGIGYEAQGSFILISTDKAITGLKEGEGIEVSIGS